MKLQAWLGATLLGVGCMAAQAADHRDGPLATGDPAADLNDVYTFINPNDPDELIVIGTIQPDAARNARFSDAVEYHFHFDNGAANGTTLVTCTFNDGGNTVLCRGAGDTLYAEGQIEQIVDADELRVFAGLRDDPFFFDVAAFNRTRADLAPRFTNPGVNGFGTFNTQSIVLGIQHDRLTDNGANPVLKVYVSSNRIDGAGVSPGHSGMWFDVNNPGHGFVFQALAPDPAIADGPHRLVSYWAVYDNAGNQLNLYGIGDIEDDRVVIPVVSHIGGRFPPASSALREEQPFGTLELVFEDCNNATLNVQPTRDGFEATTVDLIRLSNIDGVSCTQLKSGQIDRNGRPGINTATIDLLANTGKKDAYNQAEDPAGWAAAFQSEMEANLTALDTLDGVVGNSLLPPATLASVLVDDRLIIDTRIATCGAYLAVELGVAGQCGGRTLERDVIDDTLGAVVGPGVSDFVGFDDTVLGEFPFMKGPQ